jgi:hypothetical protein
MRADWPLVSRAVLATVIVLLSACAGTASVPGPEQEPLLLADENFYGQLGVERVHPNEAMARVAMAECAAIGNVSVDVVEGSAEAARLEALRQLPLALSRAGANAFSVQSQRWDAAPAGAARLVVVLQALICSA